jgi:hypothetical protein
MAGFVVDEVAIAAEAAGKEQQRGSIDTKLQREHVLVG